MTQDTGSGESKKGQQRISSPSISLPRGGGAIRGIGEKFAANPVTGTGSMTVPIATSPGRSGFGPQLSLSYDSGSGNGPFGFGWSLSIPSITRKTDKGLPQYRDADETDEFILSGAEDLVPIYGKDEAGHWLFDAQGNYIFYEDHRDGYTVRRYRPRIEGLFARIERWTNQADPADTFWRSISKDNITTWYGKTQESRISDPNDPTRIFSWLICQSYDDKGNAIIYGYVPEDSVGIDESQANECNRTPDTRKTNRFIKRIKYGNLKPNRDETWQATDPSQLNDKDWMFEVVFDYLPIPENKDAYGQHYKQLASDINGQLFIEEVSTKNLKTWDVRQDPFSSYRAGFEVRTYRLCHRVLMFHHFPDELDSIDDYLVRSTEFAYEPSPIASFIKSVTQSGYKYNKNIGKFLKISLPPLEFYYSKATIQEDIQAIDAESLENLPNGLDGGRYQWVDLDGEGLSGILTEQADAWFYKANLGESRFGPLELVTAKPSMAALSSGQQQLLDLAGDGQLDLVEFSGPVPGFYERTEDQGWEQFKPFVSLPNIPWNDPNLRFVDLTGDGHADVLITENEVFTWYLSLAEEGFDRVESVHQALDEEKGPRLVVADGTQSIYLADLSGDGLSDLARIRNGEVCYWPNLGYGRFGPKVTMDNAPWFDAPDLFDQKRIRLADIDGSGTTDIIYLGTDTISIYRNQCGNSWALPETITSFPPVDNLSSVMAVDLLGNGTICLVWSSPLPGNAQTPMKYIDLMKEGKPHLLIRTVNNLGAETIIQYAPSTKFYLKDKEAGRPWITRLPFPVHVVEQVETYDHISYNRFVTRYAYHHGYFDGEEREFRGFGRVDQQDTEHIEDILETEFPEASNIDETSYVPPVLTKTWFHTGAYIEGGKISRHFEHEYYRESDLSEGLMGLTDEQMHTMLLDDTLLPDTIRLGNGTYAPYALSAEEYREACRALKGSILRQEVYAIDKKPDGTPTEESDRPYSVSERNYTIEALQPRVKNKHAVFFTHPRETIDFHYERKLYDISRKKLADPRTSHSINLKVDAYGNVLKSVAIGYGRRHDSPDLTLADDKDKQQRALITYTENIYTNPILDDDNYRTPLLCDARTFELYKLTPESDTPLVTNLFRFDEIAAKVQSASDGMHEIPYEDIDASTGLEDNPYRRPIEQVRTLYRSNDLKNLLPLGLLESQALTGESYNLAFTPDLLNDIFIHDNKITATDLEGLLTSEGAYIDSRKYKASGLFPNTDQNGHWWIPSGQVYHSPLGQDTPTQELAFAQQHFFLPHRFHDPFGFTATTAYDQYNLLLKETRDPVGNVVTVLTKDNQGKDLIALDYRVLQPWLITDPNDNRSQVKFDALGMVTGTAVMGKVGESVGDSLDGFEADLSPSDIEKFFIDPKDKANDFLKDATTRIIYDISHFRNIDEPVYAATLARETHASDGAPPGGLKIQVSFSYSDGFGREIQKKIYAEKGPVVDGGPDIEPRWVGNGWTVFNNKGKPFKKYEPFFSNTHDFEHNEHGVYTALFYDPVERVIATIHPNRTSEKVIFDPWKQETWDVNDTVLLRPQEDSDIRGFVSKFIQAYKNPLTGEPFKTWYDGLIPDRNNKPSITSEATPADQKAALKTEAHAETPTIAHFDTLGRTFLSIANNGKGEDGTDQLYETRNELDIEGNQRSVFDAKISIAYPKGRIVIRYEYDMLGNKIFQNSMDAGARWMLNNVSGKPVRTWDSRNHEFSYAYDGLQRPTEMRVEGGDGTIPLDNLYEKIIYGEGQTLNGKSDKKLNLRGKPFEHCDTAGKIQFEGYDFKGNLEKSHRRLAKDYKNVVNWNVPDPELVLENEAFATETEYDALNRVTQDKTPDGSFTKPIYNDASLLESVSVEKDGATSQFVTDINYNEKGQRKDITHGNGIKTIYVYDSETFRLIHLQTHKKNGDLLQDLRYTYDPIGNITQIEDKARPTIFFGNCETKPINDFEYDAIYRLLITKGREHIAQVDFGKEDNWNDLPFLKQYSVNDPMAWRTYTQDYRYDEVGNIMQMKHSANGGSWTRGYEYESANNQLKNTTIGDETYTYPHHPRHGFIKEMPHLPLMRWDFKDQLQATSKQRVNDGTPEITYYTYDFSGQRVRKITENAALVGNIPARKNERIYLGSYEIYRVYANANKGLERETLQVMDDHQRIAMIETRNDVDDGSPKKLIRYQFSNHLGAACLETDDSQDSRIISYEEYHPYGTTSYQAVDKDIKVAAKRYRYTGKERDEENGLYYFGARYYVSWLGSWVSPDPVELLNVQYGLSGSVSCNNYFSGQNAECNLNKKELEEKLLLTGMEGEYHPLISSHLLTTTPHYRRGHREDLMSYGGLSVYSYTRNNPVNRIDQNGMRDFLVGQTSADNAGPLLIEQMYKIETEKQLYWFPIKKAELHTPEQIEYFESLPKKAYAKFGPKPGKWLKKAEGTTNCSTSILDAIYRLLGGTVNGISVTDPSFAKFASEFQGPQWVEALQKYGLGTGVSNLQDIRPGDIAQTDGHRFVISQVRYNKAGIVTHVLKLEANVPKKGEDWNTTPAIREDTWISIKKVKRVGRLWDVKE